MAIGDLNGDGKLDLVAANQIASNVSVLHGRGNGTFQAPVVVYASTAEYALHWVAIGDLNGDGMPDLAVASRETNDVAILLAR